MRERCVFHVECGLFLRNYANHAGMQLEMSKLTICCLKHQTIWINPWHFRSLNHWWTYKSHRTPPTKYDECHEYEQYKHRFASGSRSRKSKDNYNSKQVTDFSELSLTHISISPWTLTNVFYSIWKYVFVPPCLIELASNGADWDCTTKGGLKKQGGKMSHFKLFVKRDDATTYKL